MENTLTCILIILTMVFPFIFGFLFGRCHERLKQLSMYFENKNEYDDNCFGCKYCNKNK